jgi:hypothetical protein
MASGIPGWPQLSDRLKNVIRMPMHRNAEAAYVSGRPGSRITLKMETRSPMNPDWYTFQGPWVNGWFMEIRKEAAAASGSETSTSDSYAIAVSVPG